MAETITLGEVIRDAIEYRLGELSVALPGRIEKYDAATQRATVKIELQRYVNDGEGGFVPETLPVLPEVPIAFPQGGNGFFISFPLAKGDPVLVVFCDAPIGQWIAKGSLTEPGIAELHGLSGAVAYPGLRPAKSPLGDASSANMVIGKDGAPGSQIVLDGDRVKLGGGAQFVALENLVKARLDLIQSKFDAHTHSTALGACTAGGATGITASIGPNSTIGALADVAATKVKAT